MDEQTFTLFDVAYVLPFLRTSAFMQVLNGKKAAEVDPVLNVIIVDTKECISTTTYQKIFGEREEAD